MKDGVKMLQLCAQDIAENADKLLADVPYYQDCDIVIGLHNDEAPFVKVGEQHKPNCVIRKKTIVTRITIDFVDSVPENWDKDVIDFHYNDSSWCASNILNMLEERNNFRCLCDVASFEYLRDATEEDEEKWGVVKVNKLES